MTEIGLLKEAGAVAFGDGHKSVMNAQLMRRAMLYARDRDAIVSHFTQDANLAAEGVMNEGEFASRLGLPAYSEGGRDHDAHARSRPRPADRGALSRSLDLLRGIGRGDPRGEGTRARRHLRRVSINHLTLNESDVGDYRTFFKVSPPLRSEADRQALVAGLSEGVVDAIVSDHDPQDVETKRQPFAESADGAIGLETMLAAALRLVHSGEIALPRLLGRHVERARRRLSPARRKPRARGARADLIVFDPDEPWVVDPANLASLCKNTPFDEARLQGRVLATLRRTARSSTPLAGSLPGL